MTRLFFVLFLAFGGIASSCRASEESFPYFQSPDDFNSLMGRVFRNMDVPQDPKEAEKIRLHNDAVIGGLVSQTYPIIATHGLREFHKALIEALPLQGLCQILRDDGQEYPLFQYVWLPGMFATILAQHHDVREPINKELIIQTFTAFRDPHIEVSPDRLIFFQGLIKTYQEEKQRVEPLRAFEDFQNLVYDQLMEVRGSLKSFAEIAPHLPIDSLQKTFLMYRFLDFNQDIPSYFESLWVVFTPEGRVDYLRSIYLGSGTLLDKLFLAPLFLYGPTIDPMDFLRVHPSLGDLAKVLLTLRGIFENQDSILEGVGNPKGLVDHFKRRESKDIKCGNQLLKEFIPNSAQHFSMEELLQRFNIRPLDPKFHSFGNINRRYIEISSKKPYPPRGALRFYAQMAASWRESLTKLDLTLANCVPAKITMDPEDSEFFMEDLQPLTHLTQLGLKGFSFSPKALEGLESILKANPGLRYLSLPNNNLRESDLDFLLGCLTADHKIIKLNLSDNYVPIESLIRTPSLRGLRVLYLDGTSNNAVPLRQLPMILGAFPQLSLLSLAGDQQSLSETEAQDIQTAVASKTYNNIGSFFVSLRLKLVDERKALVAILKSFPNLKVLDLKKTNLFNLSKSPLLEILEKMPSLRRLSIYDHRLDAQEGVVVGQTLPNVKVMLMRSGYEQTS